MSSRLSIVDQGQGKVKISERHTSTGRLNVRVKNVDNVVKQLQTIIKNVDEAGTNVVRIQSSSTYPAVQRNIPRFTSQLAHSITFEVSKKTKAHYFKSSIVANPYNAKAFNGVPYLYFVYYGTGKYYHSDPRNYLPRYGYGQGFNNEWWVKVSNIDPKWLACHPSYYTYTSFYKNGNIKNTYIKMHGQEAHPFLEQGFKEMLDKNKALAFRWYSFYLTRGIK